MAIGNAVLGRMAAAGRFAAWGRVIALGQVALVLKDHFDLLEAEEKAELRRLITKSKGRPSNLTTREKNRLSSLVEKVEPSDFAREAAQAVVAGRTKRK